MNALVISFYLKFILIYIYCIYLHLNLNFFNTQCK